MVSVMDPKKHDTILSSVNIYPPWAERSTQHIHITAGQHTPRHRCEWLALAPPSCSCMPLLPHCSRHTCIRPPADPQRQVGPVLAAGGM